MVSTWASHHSPVEENLPLHLDMLLLPFPKPLVASQRSDIALILALRDYCLGLTCETTLNVLPHQRKAHKIKSTTSPVLSNHAPKRIYHYIFRFARGKSSRKRFAASERKSAQAPPKKTQTCPLFFFPFFFFFLYLPCLTLPQLALEFGLPFNRERRIHVRVTESP